MITQREGHSTYRIDDSTIWKARGSAWAIGTLSRAEGAAVPAVFWWFEGEWTLYESFASAERAGEFLADYAAKCQVIAADKAAEARMHADMAAAFQKLICAGP